MPDIVYTFNRHFFVIQPPFPPLFRKNQSFRSKMIHFPYFSDKIPLFFALFYRILPSHLPFLSAIQPKTPLFNPYTRPFRPQFSFPLNLQTPFYYFPLSHALFFLPPLLFDVKNPISISSKANPLTPSPSPSFFRFSFKISGTIWAKIGIKIPDLRQIHSVWAHFCLHFTQNPFCIYHPFLLCLVCSNKTLFFFTPFPPFSQNCIHSEKSSGVFFIAWKKSCLSPSPLIQIFTCFFFPSL